jgi:hypothetical protein
MCAIIIIFHVSFNQELTKFIQQQAKHCNKIFTVLVKLKFMFSWTFKDYNKSIIIVRVIKSRRLWWEGHEARKEEGRSGIKILTGTPTGKRPLGKPVRRWEGNIIKDLEEIRINMRNWLIWLKIGIIGKPFGMRHWTSGFSKPWNWLSLVLQPCSSLRFQQELPL